MIILSMALSRKTETGMIVRLEAGENIVLVLKDIFLQNGIEGGFFFGLGAARNIELAYFDPESHEFSNTKFAKSHEMTNVSGSVGYFGDEMVVHAHATFADETGSVVAGHLVSAEVSGTTEIIFFKTDRINKIKDPSTNLKVMDI